MCGLVGYWDKGGADKSELDLSPLRLWDIPDTAADVEALKSYVGYQPTTPVEVGVKKFIQWYREYYSY